ACAWRLGRLGRQRPGRRGPSSTPPGFNSQGGHNGFEPFTDTTSTTSNGITTTTTNTVDLPRGWGEGKAANAAGKRSGNGNPGTSQGLAVGNPETVADTLGASTNDSPSGGVFGSTLMIAPTIQPSGSEDKVNVVPRLPF